MKNKTPCKFCVNSGTSLCNSCINNTKLKNNYKGNLGQKCEHWWCSKNIEGCCLEKKSEVPILLAFSYCPDDF